QRLVAYASVNSAEVDGPTLRAWLTRRLPAYLQPNNMIIMDELPLDPNGKLDYAALPAAWTRRADLSGHALPPFVEPTTPAQVLVSGILQDALQIDQIGVDDNFFDLGGDSLRTASAVLQLRSAGVAVTAREFYRDPTVSGLAHFVDAAPIAARPEVTA